MQATKEELDKLELVSTAAWACIEFLQFARPIEYKAAFPRSQQPLGLALSFYVHTWADWFVAVRMGVSTAAWACIEFLLNIDNR